MKSVKITKGMIKEMRELRQQGVTGLEIANRFKINPTSVYLHTKGCGVRVNKAEQIRKLSEIMTAEEITKELDTKLPYVIQVISNKWMYEEKEKAKKKREKKKPENKNNEQDLTREEEVKRICERMRIEENKKKEHYKKELAEEVKRLKERFGDIKIKIQK